MCPLFSTSDSRAGNRGTDGTSDTLDRTADVIKMDDRRDIVVTRAPHLSYRCSRPETESAGDCELVTARRRMTVDTWSVGRIIHQHIAGIAGKQGTQNFTMRKAVGHYAGLSRQPSIYNGRIQQANPPALAETGQVWQRLERTTHSIPRGETRRATEPDPSKARPIAADHYVRRGLMRKPSKKRLTPALIGGDPRARIENDLALVLLHYLRFKFPEHACAALATKLWSNPDDPRVSVARRTN